MKPIKTSFVRRGFQYDQVLRDGMLAIYSQKFHDKVIAYEVIKIKEAAAHERGGVAFPPMELYPSDEQFGQSGWSLATFGDLSRAYSKALEKLNQLKHTQHGQAK